MDPNADEILRKLLKDIPGIKEAAIVSAEGLPIASALPRHVDETKLAAITAALHSLSKRANIEMNKDSFNQLFIKGSDGYLLVLHIGPNIILASGIKPPIVDDNFGVIAPIPTIPPDSPSAEGRAKSKMPKEKEESNYGIECKYCGSKLAKEQKFCRICGKKVK
ncbi:MAG: roadblock/LC7 domain-containing protein [Candidatus Hodarchaeota archaeon]